MDSFLPRKQALLFYGVTIKTLTKWHKNGIRSEAPGLSGLIQNKKKEKWLQII